MSGAPEYEFETVDDVPPKAKAKSRAADATSAGDDGPVIPEGETGLALLERAMPPIAYLCNPWAPEGLAILAGRPKLGKTTLLRQKAAAVASGGEFFGSPCKRAKVLFLSLEEGDRLMKSKLAAASFGRDALANITFQWKWRRGRDGVLDLARYLDAHPEVLYVVIDSLTRFRSVPDARTPPFMADYNTMADLHALVKSRPGLVIEVLHHTRKMVSTDPIDDVSGTYGLTAACDTYAVMRKHDQNGAVLHCGGRYWDREESQYELHRAEGQRWELVGEYNALTLAQRETLAALRSAGGMGPTEAAKFWNIGKSTAHERLEALVGHGVAYKRDGRYYTT